MLSDIIYRMIERQCFLKDISMQYGADVILDIGDYIDAGLEGDKHLVDVTVVDHGRSMHAWPMVLKELHKSYNGYYSFEKFPERTPEAIAQKYQCLKALGLPVPRTMRFNFESHSLLISDITQGGQYNILDKHQKGVYCCLTNSGELREKLSDIAIRAMAGGEGVFLSRDAYAILADKLHIGQPVILDLGQDSFKLEHGRTLSGWRPTLQDATAEAECFFEDVFNIILRP